MRKNAEFWDELMLLMAIVPDGTWFSHDGIEREVSFQATTQGGVKKIRHAFHGVWKKEFSKHAKWWEYKTDFLVEGNVWKLRVYAVTESPPACTPIWEEKDVTESVPVKWEERTSKQRVVVGYDCGGD